MSDSELLGWFLGMGYGLDVEVDILVLFLFDLYSLLIFLLLRAPYKMF